MCERIRLVVGVDMVATTLSLCALRLHEVRTAIETLPSDR